MLACVPPKHASAEHRSQYGLNAAIGVGAGLVKCVRNQRSKQAGIEADGREDPGVRNFDYGMLGHRESERRSYGTLQKFNPEVNRDDCRTDSPRGRPQSFRILAEVTTLLSNPLRFEERISSVLTIKRPQEREPGGTPPGVRTTASRCGDRRCGSRKSH